jgi:hypothetical protein
MTSDKASESAGRPLMDILIDIAIAVIATAVLEYFGNFQHTVVYFLCLIWIRVARIGEGV